MIGGTVVQVYRFWDRVSVVVHDNKDFCAIDMERGKADQVRPGDGIWWQSDLALWNPYGFRGVDLHLPRIGYSYRPEPLWDKVADYCKRGVCPACGVTETMHDGTGALWCPECGASMMFRRENLEAIPNGT